jgi:hypothetical protein
VSYSAHRCTTSKDTRNDRGNHCVASQALAMAVIVMDELRHSLLLPRLFCAILAKVLIKHKIKQ